MNSSPATGEIDYEYEIFLRDERIIALEKDIEQLQAKIGLLTLMVETLKAENTEMKQLIETYQAKELKTIIEEHRDDEVSSSYEHKLAHSYKRLFLT